MSEPIGVLTDILVAVAVMFIIPTMLCSTMADRIADMYVGQAADSFEEAICSHGYIDSNTYEAMLSKINSVGPIRHVDIVCSTTVWEPVYENGIFTGNIVSYERDSGTDEILEIVYEKGKYMLRQNDTVEVTVWNDAGSLVFVTGVVRGRQDE